LDGFDLTGCPLIRRKALLRRILPKDNAGRIRFTDHIAGNGERLFEKLEALNLEGMVMKRKDSVYAFTRCRDWLKVKTVAGKLTMQKRIETGQQPTCIFPHGIVVKQRKISQEFSSRISQPS